MNNVVLGIETSCDETAAAVMVGDRLASNVIYSQEIHSQYGGVVPELASRAHHKHIIPIVQRALENAEIKKRDITGVAVTMGPGLVGSLLVGLSFAQGLCLSYNIPCIGVNHLEAHIWATQIENKNIQTPFICLLVSGGHTQLIFVEGFGRYKTLGRTRDDAAGEAFDKVAKLLGLGYPGGKNIDNLSKQGNSSYCEFPKLGPHGKTFDFSFSGIKTAVLYYMNSISEKEKDEHITDICASFQMRVVEVLVKKTFKAVRETGCRRVVLAGGVSANSQLVKEMKETAKKKKAEVYFPSPLLCTDNGAMIANTGRQYLERGISTPLGIKPVPLLNI